MTETLRIDTGLVREAGGRLQALAGAIPPPPASHRPTGGDALSTAIAAKVAEVVDPVIAQLPVTKDALTKYAQNVVNAANTYDTVDRQIAEELFKRNDALDDAAGTGGGGTGRNSGAVTGIASGGATSAAAPAAGGAHQAGPLGSILQTPMQVARQAAQAPMQAASAIPQGAQQAVQQVGQLTETAGKGEEPGPSDESAAPEWNGERAPGISLSGYPERSSEGGPGIAL
jgi:hypothetical protein